MIWQALIEPRASDEDQKRREYILNVILLGSIAMLVVLDLFVLAHSIARGPAYHGVPFPVFSWVVVFFIGLFFLSRRGYFTAASYFLTAVYFLGASYAAYEWGANLETALLAYALIIVIASILLGTKSGFFISGITGAYLITLWHFQWHGMIDIPKTQIEGETDAITFTVLLLFITLVTWLSNREIERSLLRARRSESALKMERDSLEVRVEARTRELRQSELQKLEQLYQFAEFGQLSSGLFHDLINLTNAMSLNNERIASGVTAEALDNAHRVNGRIERFVNAMRRELAREDIEEDFLLRDAFEHVVQLLSYKAKSERVELVLQCEDAALRYFGNPFRFHQVMMNLVLNAIESYRGLEGVAAGLQRVVEISAVLDGYSIVIKVFDHGCGVPTSIRGKIFDPFFTTKSSGGMGVGLATVKKIVENDFNGTVDLRSEEGKGTTFAITIPRRDPGGDQCNKE